MKKAIGAVFFLCMFSVALFAEFTISPFIGFANFTTANEGNYGYNKLTKTKYWTKEDVSWTPFAFGFDMGVLTKSGFTFMFNNQFLTAGKEKLKVSIEKEDHSSYPYTKSIISENVVLKIGGIFWESNVLFGYTYKGIQNLDITFASGLSGGVGLQQVKAATVEGETVEIKDNPIFMWTGGVPFHFGVQYYFTKNIGINVSVVDTLNLGCLEENDMFQYRIIGFANLFTLKIGPSFKF